MSVTTEEELLLILANKNIPRVYKEWLSIVLMRIMISFYSFYEMIKK